jgi:DNA-binding transcriptional MerR regulator
MLVREVSKIRQFKLIKLLKKNQRNTIMKDQLFISELAELTGQKLSTLKFYVENGLIPFEQESPQSRRTFNQAAAVKRIKEIVKLKEKRLTIDEIKNKLSN